MVSLKHQPMGRGDGLSTISPLSLLLISGNLMGQCQFAGACSGASGIGEYPAAGLERLGTRDASPIYRHSDILTSPWGLPVSNNEENEDNVTGATDECIM